MKEIQNEFNLFNLPQEPTRLVPKDYMHNPEWNVYTELKKHLTKENCIKASDLAEIVKVDTRTLREIIKTLRQKQNAKIIGDSNGYYIGSTEEFEEWAWQRLKRTATSLTTTLDLFPNSKKIFFALLNAYKKNGIAQGQSQIQFTGYEREFIRQFAEDYESEKPFAGQTIEELEKELPF